MGETCDIHTTFYFENMKGRGQLDDLNVGWKVILKWMLKKSGLMIGTSGGSL
jgi:hypothetical protein